MHCKIHKEWLMKYNNKIKQLKIKEGIKNKYKKTNN